MRATARTWDRRSLVAATLRSVWAVLVAAACATPVVAPGSSGSASDDPQPEATDRLHRQAHDALVRWADAVRASGGASITFVGDLTSQLGTWAEDEGENKTSLAAGRVEAATALSDDSPGRKEVRWLDGTKLEVGVLSAVAALEDLVGAGSGDCPECDPLLVTEATLATSLADTSDGPAEVPTWVYSIAGSAVRVTRVAVDDSITVMPPPWNADDPPEGISIDGATGTPDSRRLDVSFTGAVEAADKPCGADYTAEAVESELAIVIIVVEQRNPSPRACDAVGRTRTAEVRLEIRLGERAVLEVRQGLPVAVTPPVP